RARRARRCPTGWTPGSRARSTSRHQQRPSHAARPRPWARGVATQDCMHAPSQCPPPPTAHAETPTPPNALGVKGVGEAGSMAPPAAIAAAVEDALRPFGARVLATPLGSEDVHRLLQPPSGRTRARPADRPRP